MRAALAGGLASGLQVGPHVPLPRAGFGFKWEARDAPQGRPASPAFFNSADPSHSALPPYCPPSPPPLCPLPGAAAGFIVERTGSFASVFHITAALYVLGTLVWNAFCSAEKQFD